MARVPKLDCLFQRTTRGLCFNRAIIVRADYGELIGITNATGVCIMAAEWARLGGWLGAWRHSMSPNCVIASLSSPITDLELSAIGIPLR